MFGLRAKHDRIKFFILSQRLFAVRLRPYQSICGLFNVKTLWFKKLLYMLNHFSLALENIE
jgi:hypothetical protein